MIWRNPWYPRIVFAACTIPFFYLVWRWVHHDVGINRIEFVARYLGIWTLRFLLMTLAITPLRRIPSLHGLIRIRRMLGLFTFFYAFLHGLHYYALDIQWNWQVMGEDLTKRRFFIVGMFAFLLMVPLALTSFDRAIRWMGGRRWQRLHRLVYISAVAGVIHYMWQGKTLTRSSLYYAIALGFLLFTRILYSAARRLTKPRPRPVAA